MTDLIDMIQQRTESQPILESGARKLDEQYFKRIEAIEYSVKYDDGKFTDIGIDFRCVTTSKTPLSMYCE